MVSMYCRASSTDTWSVNGPLLSKSSVRPDTVFLKSSAECNRSLLNFSCDIQSVLVCNDLQMTTNHRYNGGYYLVFFQSCLTVDNTLLK